MNRSYEIDGDPLEGFKCILFDEDGDEAGCGTFDEYDDAVDFGESWL